MIRESADVFSVARCSRQPSDEQFESKINFTTLAINSMPDDVNEWGIQPFMTLQGSRRKFISINCHRRDIFRRLATFCAKKIGGKNRASSETT